MPRRREGLDEGGPLARGIVRIEFLVRGHHRPQEVSEGHGDRRQVVESADAHGEKGGRRPGRLGGDAPDQIGDAGRRRRGTGGARDLKQVTHLGLVSLEECVHDRGHEYPAARVRLHDRGILSRGPPSCARSAGRT